MSEEWGWPQTIRDVPDVPDVPGQRLISRPDSGILKTGFSGAARWNWGT